MKIKNAGAVSALPPVGTVNVKAGEVFNGIGDITFKGKPHLLGYCPRIKAYVCLKPGRDITV